MPCCTHSSTFIIKKKTQKRLITLISCPIADYNFVSPTAVVWDLPAVLRDGAVDKIHLRSTYGSLKGLFVSGLSVPMHLSFDDAVSALVNIQRGSAAVVKGGERGMVEAVTAL
jgi:hypothetical protein